MHAFAGRAAQPILPRALPSCWGRLAHCAHRQRQTAVRQLSIVVSAEPLESKYTHNLPQDLVKKLVSETFLQKNKKVAAIKLGKKCVNKGVVMDIKNRWNKRDVVKVDASYPTARANLKVIRADLERMTEGVIIWNEGAQMLVFNLPKYEREQAAAAEAAAQQSEQSPASKLQTQ